LGDVERLYGDTLDARRDRALYTVTMAPEVAGRIVELPVVDNQFVAKGELLMVIDPTNYQIAVDLAQAAVQ
jgi:multidrug resistance efflux pump